MLVKSLAIASFVALAATLPASAQDDKRAGPMQPSERWEIMREDVAGSAQILDGAGLYALDSPFRAHDAATVPLHFTQAEEAPDIRRMTLVIDENPAPVAAEFEFGQAMQPVDLELRVRIDAYSNVRAIVETMEGETYMIGGFVRASGGCSAPALKDAEAAMAALGEMKLRWFDDAPDQSGARRVAQVMLRHPNYSGLQRDQMTQLFIPPHFVDRLEILQGEERLFAMTAGISISEDPTFRFVYTDSGAGLTLQATDTEGGKFERHFPFGM